MTIVNGYFDWADRSDPAPPERIAHMGGKPTPMDSIIHHSMEGVYFGRTGYAAFRDPQRYPTAWHWTVKRTGRLFQHAPVDARLVHAHAGNIRGPGGESEGFKGEPLTPSQVSAWLHIHADMREYTGIDYQRVPGSRRGLVEHNEFGPTTCPNGRYEPLWEAIRGGEDLTADEVRAIVREEIGKIVDDDVDDRLRQVMGVREAMRRLASHPKVAVVEQAWAAAIAAVPEGEL